jgi:hypothetical protein
MPLSERDRSTGVADTVNDTLALMDAMLARSESVRAEQLVRARALVARAVKTVDSIFSEDDAIKWAGDFEFPEMLTNADLASFVDSNGSLLEMARARWLSLQKGRLNPGRVRRCISPDNPDLHRLVALAGVGMPVPVPAEFVPNGSTEWPRLRNTYRRLAAPVNRLLFEQFYQKGLAIILPAACVRGMQDVHLSVNSWTPKSGKVEGRPIGDCSDGGAASDPLNSDWVKQHLDGTMGVISHPTLTDLVRQIIEYAEEPGVRWCDLRLWKMDLAGAYTLLSFDPSQVKRLGFELTGDRVMFMLCGIFGWTGTPACFQVVTRAILFELRRKLTGRVSMYVDDIMGVCLARDVARNVKASAELCTALLGPTAIATHKTEWGRRLTEIGFDIDLDALRVEVSEKNRARALAGFLTVAQDGRATVRDMEKLASWACRYSDICVYMKPFVSALYSSYAGKATTGFFRLSNRAMRAVRVLRVLFVMIELEPQRYCRSLLSFTPKEASMVVEYDASLSGVGVLLYSRAPGRADCPVGGFSVDITSLGFGTDAGYQNAAEFIAAVLGTVCLVQLFPTCKSFVFRGDSMSALSWARSGRAKGDRVFNSAFVFVSLLLITSTGVAGTEHLSSEENFRTDELSRGTSVQSLRLKHPELAEIEEYVVDSGRVLQVCDPAVPVESDEDWVCLWRKVGALCTTVKDTH